MRWWTEMSDLNTTTHELFWLLSISKLARPGMDTFGSCVHCKRSVPRKRWLDQFRVKAYSQSKCFFFGPRTSSVVALQTTRANPWPASAYLAALTRSEMDWPPNPAADMAIVALSQMMVAGGDEDANKGCWDDLTLPARRMEKLWL